MSCINLNYKNNYSKFDNKSMLDYKTECIHFVETNFSKCKLYIENRECNLLEYYYVKNKKRKKTFEIKLINL